MEVYNLPKKIREALNPMECFDYAELLALEFLHN